MTITPADIEAQQFPIVFRGYKVEAVDEFLDQLQVGLAQVLLERPGEAAMTGPAAAGTADETPVPAPGAATPPGADPAIGAGNDSAARALRTLQRAEQMAEQVMAEAAAEADEIQGRARAEAETMIAAARAESGRIEAELNVRQQREVGGLMVQAQHLRAEIDRLSGLERHYHEALHALLTEQQQLLEQRIPVLDPATANALASVADGVRPAA